ncbi:hypothetical protein [Rhodospirillum rubrum]|uniref:DUF2333 domain-containing protein n=1 Tax=Rhodospirillum rubrum (strain ATCC 11170 / ATH 1.1.1 / DSM 467 / LMG 4362 / NCIMB 8255 / S1) TaxID=269796 RepID=Q2RNG7_RHORT|nr:hypothetical protein [Rhodospirillum rubrum]ABC24328.1 conserved hypothetical protein [Rhodospirillum rubrum ATCC 11170]AEO50079.1 hypothetical protein F11_18095 [Rhodospirillum rubrum F11]MBK5956046.1 hypothetical protein [Rhodospirillum rubrum]QXG80255.1 hypothetical protein KUL73_18245 [Rhodospirillum rubrum]HAQ00912.1 hypothetical protein [Rhodospirillum rubrum]
MSSTTSSTTGIFFDRLIVGVDRLVTGGLLLKIVVVFAVAAALYYPVGMAITHRINDDLAYQPAPTEASQTVAMAAGLIDREVARTPWVADSPWFFATSALDDMANFQQGVISGLHGVVGAFGGALAGNDGDLTAAVGGLAYPGDRWRAFFETTPTTQPPSEEVYLEARKALLSYDRRASAGEAVFDPSAPALAAFLVQIRAEVAATLLGIDRQIASAGAFNRANDDVYMTAKGQAYAWAMSLAALGRDGAATLEAGAVPVAWSRMVETLNRVATLRPWVVTNGAADALIVPNHLASQGFLLARAQADIDAVIAALGG